MREVTKAELIKALEPYADDQYVFVNVHSEIYPNGSQVAIQAVRPQEPWHPGPQLIGLVAHVQNAAVVLGTLAHKPPRWAVTK